MEELLLGAAEGARGFDPEAEQAQSQVDLHDLVEVEGIAEAPEGQDSSSVSGLSVSEASAAQVARSSSRYGDDSR